mgnify:FL=1
MTKKNYIQPAEFFHEMLVCLKKDEISDDLSRMFIMLAERYANHQHYVRFVHIRDDIISECIFACVKGFPKFRPYRNIILERDEDGVITKTKPVDWNGEIVAYDYKVHNNPHAYVTTCMNHMLRQFLKTEYNQRNICNKMKLDLGLEADQGYVDMINDQEAKARDAAEAELEENFIEDTIEWEG